MIFNYTEIRQFYFDKGAEKCSLDPSGHGRFESAFFHTIKKVHDDAHAESAAHIATLQADIKTLCVALKTTSEGNAELLRQREAWLATCRSVVKRGGADGIDLFDMEEFIATTERKPA